MVSKHIVSAMKLKLMHGVDYLQVPFNVYPRGVEALVAALDAAGSALATGSAAILLYNKDLHMVTNNLSEKTCRHDYLGIYGWVRKKATVQKKMKFTRTVSFL